MARTPSNMIPLGYKAPDFTLPDVISGQNKSLNDLAGNNGTLIMFICNHCPFVIHIQDELVRLANDYIDKGFKFIAINSNDIENYPDDHPEKMKDLALRLNYPFPYLFDESQSVAKAYDAACTPDFYLFDSALKCVYRGQLDDSRPQTDIPVNGKDIRKALDKVLSGEPIDPDQKPSLGCNIKWKT